MSEITDFQESRSTVRVRVRVRYLLLPVVR